MKQKQVKVTPKAVKQLKVEKKATPARKIQEVVEDDDDEEEVIERNVAKKPANKKSAAKVQKVVEVVAPEEDEEDEEEADDQEDDEEQDEDDVEEAIDAEDDDEQVDEEDEQVDEDDEQEEEDEQVEEDDEQDEEEEGDNDEDAEESEEPTMPSKVKSGEIPSTIPPNRVVHVTKLPKKCKQVDVVEVFAKYGAIEQIHIVTTPGGTVANVAYKTEKSAKAALAANKKVKVHDCLIVVSPYSKKDKKDNQKKPKINETRDRSVYVRYLKAGTTEEQLREHFEDCGEVERIKVVSKHNTTFGFITFAEKACAEKAIQLHNSVLNGVNIGVCENNDNPTKVGQLYDEKLTVMVKNTQNLASVDSSKLVAIFKKCGEIAGMDVVCRKNILAFITFKTEQAAQKAIKLNGKTENGLELELELYNPYNKKTTIYVSNLPRGCTEEDLLNCFSRAGEIAQIHCKGAYAIIRFEHSDGYCKSFLYNESFINKQMIFVEPHSMRKRSVMKSKLLKNFNKKAFKRPAENGNSIFKAKKAKIH